MKVCLIATNTQKFCPYVSNYIDIIKNKGIDYDIIQWDRRCNDIKTEGNVIIYGGKMPSSKWKKLFGYLKWKKFIESHLKNNNYDRIIIFTSIAGVLINKTLTKRYKEKYIYDIRDYSFEQYGFYKKIVDKLIENSYITSISSKGFMRFLSPSKKIMVNHNMPDWFSKLHNDSIEHSFSKPIKIGYLGMISYFEQNKRICEQIKNNSNFTAEYYGTLGKTNIIEYCNENSIGNVNYHGSYNNADKFEIYKNIDFINAVYGNDRMLVTSALPNKLYDCIVCKKPIIASDKTYLSEIVQEYNLGISLSNEANIAEEIEEFVNEFDVIKFNNGCNNLFNLVVKENSEITQKIHEFINE